jgi:hypothetical protein
MASPALNTVLKERDAKIVEALYRLSPAGPKVVTYEDIVVKAWTLYPDDFGLRGYAKLHPDASDIHKRLYNSLKSKGWVSSAGQKKFSLTLTGWDRASSFFSAGSGAPAEAAGRAERTAKLEIEHLEKSAAASLYMAGTKEEILDTDFFDFYRTSVRATPQEFESRLAVVEYALREAEQTKRPTAPALRDVDKFLREQFKDVISVITERKKREGR